MKKRKPPVLLASILVVLVGAVAIMNGPSSKASDDGHGHGEAAEEHSDDSKVLDPGRNNTESKEALASIVKSKVVTGQPKLPPGAGDDSPVIVAPKASKYVPKPGESPTSSQWHRDESLASTEKK